MQRYEICLLGAVCDFCTKTMQETSRMRNAMVSAPTPVEPTCCVHHFPRQCLSSSRPVCAPPLASPPSRSMSRCTPDHESWCERERRVDGGLHVTQVFTSSIVVHGAAGATSKSVSAIVNLFSTLTAPRKFVTLRGSKAPPPSHALRRNGRAGAARLGGRRGVR